VGEEDKEQVEHGGKRGRREEERFGGRVPAALHICFRDKKCLMPCYLQGLVRQIMICPWLTAGASKPEQLNKTVLQPNREQGEREGTDLLHQPKGDKKFPVTKKKRFSPGTLNMGRQEALSNYSDSLKRSLHQGHCMSPILCQDSGKGSDVCLLLKLLHRSVV